MTAPVQNPSPEPAPGPGFAPAVGVSGAAIPAHLRLIGTSEDGAWLRLLDEEGTEHRLANDDRLSAMVQRSEAAQSLAPRGNPAPLGGRPREKTMESTLRPRDIQARIRAGETPEAVAAAAQTSVERIMAFAAPVLAEREHVAQRAQRSSVRRTDAATGGARTLGEAVEAHLRGRNVDPASVEWDAWRREDGRWSLIAAFETAERAGCAELTFDAPGNYVTLDNEDARWLVGEALHTPEPAQDDLRAVRERRRSTVQPADQELPLGDDAIDLVSDQPVEAFLDTDQPTDETVREHEADLVEEAGNAAAAEEADPEPDPEPEAAEEPEPPARRPVKKTRGRASVPSWDEIMFGGPSGSDRA